jgi:hypothetical protein
MGDTRKERSILNYRIKKVKNKNEKTVKNNAFKNK